MITTHVLDLSRGVPAAGMTVILELRHASEWSPVARTTTDQDGRASTLTENVVVPGTYRMTFDTGTYLRDQGVTRPFFPQVTITFQVLDGAEHFHVPLLLSPFSFSAYRGS
jgi:5-hydroxyisourate hydrolase